MTFYFNHDNISQVIGFTEIQRFFCGQVWQIYFLCWPITTKLLFYNKQVKFICLEFSKWQFKKESLNINLSKNQ